MTPEEFFIWQIHFEHLARPQVIEPRGAFIRHELTNPPQPKPATEAAHWLSVAWLVLMLWLLMSLFSTAHGGEVGRARRLTRITVLRPVRVKARAEAGYPLLSTMANTTRVAANLTSPLSWFF